MPATTPYRKKSYHSMVAPIRLAKTTRRTFFSDELAAVALMLVMQLSPALDGAYVPIRQILCLLGYRQRSV